MTPLPNKTSKPQKAVKKPARQTDNDLETDKPLSEKDEVKKAEERTNKGAKRSN